jgi:ECF sigma factor.
MEYLDRPRQLRYAIDRKHSRISTLRGMSQRLTARLQEAHVASSPDPARMQAFLSEALDEEKELEKLEEEEQLVLVETALTISRLPDDVLARLLEMRYLEGLTWRETAARLGYSDRQTLKLHRKALDSLPVPEE